MVNSLTNPISLLKSGRIEYLEHLSNNKIANSKEDLHQPSLTESSIDEEKRGTKPRIC